MRDAFPPPMCCVVVFIHLRMETPLCGRSGGHAGTAPTVSFGQITCGTVDFVWDELRVGRLISFEWITRKWLFGLCGIAWKNMMEFGRGGAYVPARVAPQGRIHRSIPRIQCVFFGMETPLRGRSGGHAGTAPTISFGQIARGTVEFVWVDCARTVGFVGMDCM